MCEMLVFLIFVNRLIFGGLFDFFIFFFDVLIVFDLWIDGDSLFDDFVCV